MMDGFGTLGRGLCLRTVETFIRPVSSWVVLFRPPNSFAL